MRHKSKKIETAFNAATINSFHQVDINAAQSLNKSVARAHDAILARRAEMDATGQLDKPLFVLIGEDHESVQHYLHHMVLLDRLAQYPKSLAIAYEQPYDLLARFYRDNGAYEPNRQLVHYMNDVDRDTAVSVKLRFSAVDNFSAYFAHKALAHTVVNVMDAHLDARFIGSDISYDSDELIETEDMRAADSLRRAGLDANEMYHISSPEGIHARNQHMARYLLDETRRYPASIVLQFCGIAHLNGDGDENRAEWGLAQILKAQGADVLIMPLKTESFVMPETGLAQDDIVKCKLPIGPYAEYDPRFELSTKYAAASVMPNIMRSKAQEAYYINQQLYLAGEKHLALAIDDYEALKNIYGADVAKLYKTIDRSFYGIEDKKLAPAI